MTKEQMLRDRVQYAIKELQEAEKLLAEVTDLSTAVDTLPTLKEMEDCYIEHVFQKTNGSIKATSTILDIDRTTLWRRIKGRQALTD